jgi:hypothetical protein
MWGRRDGILQQDVQPGKKEMYETYIAFDRQLTLLQEDWGQP